MADKPCLFQRPVQRLDEISLLVPSRQNFDKFRDANARTATPWTYHLRQFLFRMDRGDYDDEFIRFAGSRRQSSQVKELFSLFQQALHYNDR